MPNLIEIQKNSYDWFLKEGLKEVFDDVSGITDFNGNLVLDFVNYKLDEKPIDEQCDCPTCQNFSRAYLRHLFKAEEILALRLAVMHNLYFYNNMMTEIRTALDEGNFASYKRAKLAGFEEYDKK